MVSFGFWQECCRKLLSSEMLRGVNKYIVTDVSKSHAYIITGTHFTVLKVYPFYGCLCGFLEVVGSLKVCCQYFTTG